MGNEKVVPIAQDSSKEAADKQAEASLAAGEASYIYQRADGTVERAYSAADAFRRCPVLGELAIKSPDQANILLELAAAGNEIIAAEAKKVPQIPKVSEKSLPAQEKPEPKKQATVTQAEHTTQTETELINRDHTSNRQQNLQRDAIAHLQTEPTRQQAQAKSNKKHENKLDFSPAEEKAKPSEAAEGRELTTAPIEIKVAKAAAVSRDEVVAVVNPKVVEAPLQETIPACPVVAEARPLEPESEPLEIVVEKDHIENVTEAEISATETAAYEIDDAPQAAITELDEPEEPEMFLGMATDDEEYDPASADELFQIPAIEVEAVIDALSELDDNTALQTEPLPDFETFIAVQPASEEPVNLESIREQADEQPLEQTLAQLVEFLSEPSEIEIPEHKAILGILNEITNALPAIYDSQQSVETKPKSQITPEMIEKLLILLRTLGYQHPHEALIGFIKLYGVVYALQAITYMCQLKNPDNQQEYLLTSDDQYNDSLCLGRLLFGLNAAHTH